MWGCVALGSEVRRLNKNHGRRLALQTPKEIVIENLVYQKVLECSTSGWRMSRLLTEKAKSCCATLLFLARVLGAWTHVLES